MKSGVYGGLRIGSGLLEDLVTKSIFSCEGQKMI